MRIGYGTIDHIQVGGVLVGQHHPATPIGTVIWKASASVPIGFLECDGSAISRTTYADLFADIGTVFGVGDGSTTFNLPNAQSSVLAGVGQGAGLTAIALGEHVGVESHALTEAQMPVHLHVIQGALNDGGAETYADTGGTLSGSINSNNAGSGNAHPNVQPTLGIHCFIQHTA